MIKMRHWARLEDYILTCSLYAQPMHALDSIISTMLRKLPCNNAAIA